MRTLEEVNGQKVWAVDIEDATALCDGCMYKEGVECPNSLNTHSCNSYERTDKRNVIFQPYNEEQEEKTFTLSKINEVIDELIRYSSFNHQTSFEHRLEILNQLKQKLEQL